MKTLILIAVSLLITACDPAYTAPGDCLVFHSEIPLDRDILASNVQLAQKLFEPVLGDAENFCGAFSNVRIVVAKELFWNCPGTTNADGLGCVSGTYTDMIGIRLGADTMGLAHELLHAWEALLRINPDDTNEHTHWKEKGWHALDIAYIVGQRDPRLIEVDAGCSP